MLLQQLEDAARVLQRLVLLRRLAVFEFAAVGAVGLLAFGFPHVAFAGRGRLLHPLVLPAFAFVFAALGVEPGEEPVEVLGVAEVV